MKKLILTLTISICLFSINGKAQPFVFSHYTAIYNDLTNPTIAWGNTKWSYLINSIPRRRNIGFKFNFFGKNYTTVDILNDGILCFVRPDNAGLADYLWVNFTKLKSRADTLNSTIVFQTDGISPNRIFKVEYHNVGFEFSNDTSNYTNFQVWLFETSNNIEYHYGPSKFDSTCWWYNKGAYIGMDTSNAWSYFLLGGNVNNPVFIFGDTILYSGPTNEMVYKFSSTKTGINELAKNNSFNIYPNPAINNIMLSTSANTSITQINLVDIVGKNYTMNYEKENENYIIDVSEIPTGIYFLQATTNNGVLYKKVLIEK